jgi:hypothetical protein
MMAQNSQTHSVHSGGRQLGSKEEQQLGELIAKLKQAAGSNLKCIILYGSAATGEFQSGHSDLNIICVLDRLGTAELQKLSPVSAWWIRKRHPAPLVFTLEELRQFADVFAIELLDIKQGHRLLYGEDVFTTLDVPMDLHHLQLERELRNHLVRLRQQYLRTSDDNRAVIALMTGSVSSFAALFRHSLIALREQSDAEPHRSRRDVVGRLSDLLGFDPSGFYTVLDVREGRRPGKQVDAQATFQSYLDAVVRVVRQMDERLPEAHHG